MEEIKLLKDNSKNSDLSDIEIVEQFYLFLVEEKRLTHKKAFSIIYFLQEEVAVFPDRIEKCSTCKCLFDSYSGGAHSESKGTFHCDNCRKD